MGPPLSDSVTPYIRYTGIGKHTWPIISTVISKLKYFSSSQAVTYTVKVVISLRRYTIETLLLQLKSYIIIDIFPMTLSDLQCIHKSYWRPFQMRFLYSCAAGDNNVILIRTCSIEWCYCWPPWMILTTPNHSIFDILYIAFHIFIMSGVRDFKFGR